MSIDHEREQTAHFNAAVLPLLVKELNAIDHEVWTIQPPTEIDIEHGAQWRNPSLINATGERLHIRVGGYQHDNKITVSGTYGALPDGQNWYVHGYMRSNHTDPSATMTLSKSPKQLAADILRRVLQDGYRFYRGEYLKRCQEQTDNINATADTAKRIEKASGGLFYVRPSYHGMNDIKKGSVVMDSHGARVGLKVSGTDVEIDWRGAVEEAEHLVKMIAVIQASRPKED